MDTALEHGFIHRDTTTSPGSSEKITRSQEPIIADFLQAANGTAYVSSKCLCRIISEGAGTMVDYKSTFRSAAYK